MLVDTKYNIAFIIFSLLLITKVSSQVYNTDIEAKIFIKAENNLIKITGTAFNKTELNQNFRYVLSVIKTNQQNSNRSKNDQSGRLFLEPGQKNELSSTTINESEKDQTVILLLIYDLDDKIIGKDRIAFNEDPNADHTQLKEKFSNNLNAEDVREQGGDGVFLRGIVIDEVKTKPGQDFYRYFFSEYTLKRINAPKVITIKEALVFANSTIISVFVEDKLVYRFLVKPQPDYLKENSSEAIRKVSRYLETLKKNKRSINQY